MNAVISLSAFNLVSALRIEYEGAAGSCLDLARFQRDVLKAGGRVQGVRAVEAETGDGWCLQEGQLAISGIQVARTIYDTLTVPKGLAQAELEALALASEKVQRALDGAAVRKVIVVPDRLVNIVA